MPKLVRFEGVEKTVSVPDDTTDEELSELGDLLSKGRVASAAATVAREPGRMAGQAVSGLARMGQLFGDSFGTFGGEAGMSFQDPDEPAQRPGAELAKDLEQNELYQAGQNLRKGAEDAFQPNPLHEDKFESAVASGLGSVIGLVPAMLAGPLAPLAVGAEYGLSAGEDMAQEAGDVLDQRIATAKALGDSQTAANLERQKFHIQSAAFLAGAPIGAFTQGGVGVAAKLGPMILGQKTAVGSLAKKIVEGVTASPVVEGAVEGIIREGTQETTEQIAQNLAAREIYDPTRGLTEGLVKAGGAGAVVGGLFGAGAGALRRRRVAPTAEERDAAPESAEELDRMLAALANAPAPVETEEEAVLTPPMAVPTPAGTVTAPPTPETPATIQAQVDFTLDPNSTKSVTLVTPGEWIDPAVWDGLETEGLKAVETQHGVAIFNPDKISQEQVALAAAGAQFDPEPLGMGALVPESDIAVTTRTPDGTEVISELATPETIPAAVEKQQAAAPGMVTSVVPAAEVVKARKRAKKKTESQITNETGPSAATTGAIAGGTLPIASQAQPSVSGAGTVVPGQRSEPAPAAVQPRGPEVASTPAPENRPVEQPKGAAVRTPGTTASVAAEAIRPAESKVERAGGATASVNTPAEAVADVKTQVDTVAATEGPRSAKEVKSELVSRLEEALKTADEDKLSTKTVTIAIPGDGTFKIAHTKANLSEVLRRAKALQTSAGNPNPTGSVRGSTIPKLGTGLKSDAALKALQEFVHQDDRPGLTEPYTEKDRAIATNGKIAVQIDGQFKPSGEDSKFPTKGVDEVFSDAKNNANETVTIPTDLLFRIGRMAKRLAFEKIPTVTIYADKEGNIFAKSTDDVGDTASLGTPTEDRFLGMLNADDVVAIATLARRMGDESVRFSRSDVPQKAGMNRLLALYEGEGWKAVEGRVSKEGVDPQDAPKPAPENEAPKTEAERIADGTKRAGDTAPDRIEAALNRAIEATRIEPGSFEFTRAVPQAALHAILRAARVLYRAGRSLAEAIQEAIRQHRADNPQDQFEDAAMQQAVTEAIQAEDLGRREGVTTKRGAVHDTIAARPGLTPETRADAVATTERVLKESGIKYHRVEGENLFRPTEDFEQEIEGRKLLQNLNREIERATLDGRPERVSNLLNTVREHFAGSPAFSPGLQADLYMASQSKASELGRGLGALAIDAAELGNVARNVRGELSRILFSRFNGETIQRFMDRMIIQFRDMFTDAEIDNLSADDPRLAGIMDRINAAARRDSGGRVYRAVQARLKPKKNLTPGQKERLAKEQEAIDQIIENAKKIGVVEPKAKPGNKLTPEQRLGLMTRPETQAKIQAATEQAVTDAEFNAGWKIMESDAASDPDLTAEYAERRAAGETPEENAIERGLMLPEFAHWKSIRDQFLNYSPTTLKLVQEVIKGRFKGTRFDEPNAKKPEVRIDLNALAKSPEAEANRVIQEQLDAVSAVLDLNGATPETKARVMDMVSRNVAAQLQGARKRVVEGFLSPTERPAPKTAGQRLRELINAGIASDPRYQQQKTRDLLKRVVDARVKANEFAEMAGRPRAEKLAFLESKFAEAIAAENIADDWMHGAVWTRLTERMMDAESSLANRLSGTKDVSFEARSVQTPAERAAAHHAAVAKLEEGVRAGLLDQRLVDEVAMKPVFQRLLPTMRDLVRAVLDTPQSGQGGLAKSFSQAIQSQLAIDPALADKVGAGLAAAFGSKIKAARQRALAQSLAKLAPEERRAIGPGTPAWKAIEGVVNSGGMDTPTVLQALARSKGWNIPTDAEVAKLRADANEEQRLRTLTEADRARGMTQEEKEAATRGERSRLIRSMRTQWAAITRPFSDKTARAEAVGELMGANLLFRMAFGTKQIIDVATQSAYDTATRAYAAAAENYENDKSAGRETRFWSDTGAALAGAIKARLGSVRMAMAEAVSAAKGQSSREFVAGMTSEVRFLERTAAQADKLAAEGKTAAAFALRLVSLLRFSFRFASALDALQGVGAEQQSMREQTIAALRGQGMTPEEAESKARAVIGDMESELALAKATVSMDPDIPEAQRNAAAWEVVKSRQYARMAENGINAGDARATNETLRDTLGWNSKEQGGPGGVVAAGMDAANRFMQTTGIPFKLPFANAIAIGVNRATTWAGGGFIPSMFGASPWFATPKDRSQRKAEAALGLTLSSAVLGAAAVGLLQAFTRWPDDPDERALWEREGHRPNTVEFHYGDGKFLRMSLNSGPMAILRPVLSAIAEVNRLGDKLSKQNAALAKRAEKQGVPFDPVKASTEDMLGAGMWAAYKALFGGRTTEGMIGAATDYQTPSLKKMGASALGSVTPYQPLMREIGMMRGAIIDPNKSDFLDLLLPTPGSGAQRRNFLGDPVGTPRDAERIASILTGGTALAGGADEPAYRLLRDTGWRPSTPSPSRQWEIDGKLRQFTPEEQARFEKIHGEALKASLNKIAVSGVTDRGDLLDDIKDADKDALRDAKDALGVD